jgi:hypothetical protein
LVFSRLPNYCRATNQIGFVAHSSFAYLKESPNKL